MLSYLRSELLHVVRACPLASVAVGCDRYSVGYSPLGSRGDVGRSLDLGRPGVQARLPRLDWERLPIDDNAGEVNCVIRINLH
jgi:hypothetical protein